MPFFGPNLENEQLDINYRNEIKEASSGFIPVITV